MPDMRCERCHGYRLYSQPVIAVRGVGGRLTATIEREGTPPRVHGPEPVGRWYIDCYDAARVEDRNGERWSVIEAERHKDAGPAPRVSPPR